MTRRSAQGRGFLFADLRGYTAFAEARGDRAAAALLSAYRAMVRGAIARFDGAEIRTEGDSFYVVFPSATDAVLAGVAILDGAVQSTDAAPIRVGIGVHVGETTETDEGYVGSAVNIAARVCAVAGAGELLVTDTVRALAKGQLDVRFVPRGRKRLKGVAEPVTLYAVTSAEAPISPRRSPAAGLRNLRRPVDRVALPLALAVGLLILTAGAIALIGRDLGGSASEQPASPLGATASSRVATPSAAPSEPSQAASRAEAEERLRARIDPDVARLCTSADPEDAPDVNQGFSLSAPLRPLTTLGGLRCDLGGAAGPDVVYFWRGVAETQQLRGEGTEDAFFTIAGERNLPRGDCATDTRAWGTWDFLGTNGNLLCSRFGGVALLAWTYEGEPIIALAEREDGDSERLYRWWLDHARDLAPEPGS